MRVARIIALLAALFGMAAYLDAQTTRLQLSAGWKLAASALVALLVLWSLVAAPCKAAEQGELKGAWRAALGQAERSGFSLAPLVLLPLRAQSTTFAAFIFTVTAIAYGIVHGRALVDARLLGADRGHLLAPWEASLFGFCALVTVLYVWIGAHPAGNFQADSAYYYGVAKHIAQTGRFEEPIVWHFLRKPAHVPALPFDYWGGLTSLTLAPFLAIFGQSQKVADTVMAIFSAGSVAIFAYLLTVERIVQNRIVAAALLVAFAFVPDLDGYRFDTETIPLCHFLLLLGLLMVVQKRWAWASLCAGLLYHVRSDTIFITLLMWAWALGASYRAGTWKRVVAVQAALLVATLGYGTIAFGAPLGVRGLAVRLRNQAELYVWGARSHVHLLASRLNPKYLGPRIGAVVHNLIRIVPGGALLLGWLVTAGAIPGDEEHGPSARLLLWSLGLPCALAVGIVSGPMFVPWRTLHSLIPLVMLGGGSALDSLLGRLSHWHELAPWAQSAGGLVLIGVTVAAALNSVHVYGHRRFGPNRSAEIEITKLDRMLGNDVVASNLPWYVIADTHSSAVNIPIDGKRAVREVFRRYHVRWVLLVGNWRTLSRSARLFAHRGAWKIGDLRLEQRLQRRGLRLIEVGPD